MHPLWTAWPIASSDPLPQPSESSLVEPGGFPVHFRPIRVRYASAGRGLSVHADADGARLSQGENGVKGGSHASSNTRERADWSHDDADAARGGGGSSVHARTGCQGQRRVHADRAAPPAPRPTSPTPTTTPRSSRRSRSTRPTRNEIVGASQQDRWPDGGARGLTSWSSTNGGTSWAKLADVPWSACQGGPERFGRVTDPWVSYDKAGQPVLHRPADRLGRARASPRSR